MSNKAALFNDIFIHLRDIMLPYADKLDCKHNTADHLYIDTKHIMKNKKPLFFGAVKIGKSYVSYHLMPVYVNPELLNDIPDDLRACMQGKSCFNFKALDTGLFYELKQLTKLAYAYYRQESYI